MAAPTCYVSGSDRSSDLTSSNQDQVGLFQSLTEAKPPAELRKKKSSHRRLKSRAALEPAAQPTPPVDLSDLYRTVDVQLKFDTRVGCWYFFSAVEIDADWQEPVPVPKVSIR